MPSPTPRDGGPLSAAQSQRAHDHYLAMLEEAQAEKDAREVHAREARTARYEAADARNAEARANGRLQVLKEHVGEMQEALSDLWHAADEVELPSVALQEALDNARRYFP